MRRKHAILRGIASMGIDTRGAADRAWYHGGNERIAGRQGRTDRVRYESWFQGPVADRAPDTRRTLQPHTPGKAYVVRPAVVPGDRRAGWTLKGRHNPAPACWRKSKHLPISRIEQLEAGASREYACCFRSCRQPLRKGHSRRQACRHGTSFRSHPKCWPSTASTNGGLPPGSTAIWVRSCRGTCRALGRQVCRTPGFPSCKATA